MKKLIILSTFILSNLFIVAQNANKVAIPPANERAEKMTEKMDFLKFRVIFSENKNLLAEKNFC